MNPSDNNSFGMPSAAGGQGMMAQSVAPRDTGDILLPGSEKKGGKKWLYAVLGVVAVVILVAVGAWMITRGDGGSSSTSGVTAQSLFNTYANYFLSGSNSNETVDGEYESFESSYIGKKIASGEITQDELDTAKKYYDAFYSGFQLEEKEDGDNEYINSLLTRYKSELLLLTIYYSGENLTQNKLMQIYFENGESAAEAEVEEQYSKYSSVGAIYGMNYADIVKSSNEKTIELAKLYFATGCVNDGDIDYICISDNMTDNINNVVAEYSKEYSDLLLILNTSEKDVYSGIFEINNLMTDDVEEENETEE